MCFWHRRVFFYTKAKKHRRLQGVAGPSDRFWHKHDDRWLIDCRHWTLWQFRQNWNAGTTPAGAPVFSLVPPQIQQTAPHPALPPPNATATTPFFSGYNLSDAGITAFANELYAIRDAISKRVELGHMSTDSSAGALLNSIGRACDQAGVECPSVQHSPELPE
jgi:hypothetical protein